MAYSSSFFSSSTLVSIFDVFPSYHGPDVRTGILSHIRTQFASNNIETFDDEKMLRGHTIRRELYEAIRGSRVSIVVLSKKYASSKWCLDELVEIFNCRKTFGQIVTAIFYEVDPYEVREQIGDFGKAFEETCKKETEEVKQRWTEALEHVASIAGYHSRKWPTEAEMIQKIATDVKNVLPSSEYGEKVRIDVHMNEVESLGYNYDAKMFETRFQWRIGSLKGSCKIIMCKVKRKLVKDILEHYLRAIKERLRSEEVRLILDDVSLEDRKKLKSKGKEIVNLFCPASRVIVTKKDKETLKACGIHDIYHVNLESEKESFTIRRLSFFKRSYARHALCKLVDHSKIFDIGDLANQNLFEEDELFV